MSELKEMVDQVKRLFEESLCDGQLHLNEATGYFSPCVINTYLIALPQVVFLLFLLRPLMHLTDGVADRSRIGHAKFILAMVHVAVLMHFGPRVFNVISVTATLFSLLVTFVVSYMEQKGVNVPSEYLQVYYFLQAAGFGYFALSLIAARTDLRVDRQVPALTIMFLSSLINGAFRNIIGAMLPSATAAVKRKAE